DTIVLAAGVTYSGNFSLPNKTAGSGWITIRTSNLAGISSENVRITPAQHAQAMPKLMSPNSASALETQAGAHHYRVIGVELGFVETPGDHFDVVHTPRRPSRSWKRTALRLCRKRALQDRQQHHRRLARQSLFWRVGGSGGGRVALGYGDP